MAAPGHLRVRSISVISVPELLIETLTTTLTSSDEKNGVLMLALETLQILRTNSGARTIIIEKRGIAEANVMGEGVIAVAAKAAG
jgi:hypothetical protein